MASVVQFQKALQAMHQSFDAYIAEQDVNVQKMLRDSVIQRFEFCVELSWKTSMKVLGLMTSAPKPAIRDMARAGLIDDPERWFKFIDARNKTSHTYDEEIAKEVLEVAEQFLPEGYELLKALQTQ
ncbi:MAG: nucleotidyltransferase substrate binding protein [Bdellovibrionaceae bacterium]|nr:HI0074 family nucleotidyltransferase substrate-binding subunit [Bdellovibrionales bacterium]MCB9083174.1 nucleotidyltransferase substrate binding protein [Pseudobdellovibrionaceae bacterium]